MDQLCRNIMFMVGTFSIVIFAMYSFWYDIPYGWLSILLLIPLYAWWSYTFTNKE